MRIRESLWIGWKSAKVNALPMAVLWLAAVVLVISYHGIPFVRDALEPSHRALVRSGWIAAAVCAGFFCGIVPGVFQLALCRLRPPRPFLVIAAQTTLSAVNGVLCWKFYEFQMLWFGTGTDIGTLLRKMLVDQFVWTPLVIAPLGALGFFVIARDFSLSRVRRDWPESWIGGILLPNLVSMWCVNVVPNFCLYAFPPLLQIQLVGLLYSFWTLMCFQIALRSGRTERRD